MFKYLVFVFCCIFCLEAHSQKTTIVCGEIKNPSDRNVRLVLSDYIGITGDKHSNIEMVNGKFKFNFKLKHPAYYSLDINDVGLSLQVIEPGDSINISFDAKHPQNISFTGKGAANAAYQHKATQKFKWWFEPLVAATADNFDKYFNFIDSGKIKQINYLNSCRKGLSNTVYQVLKTDIIYECESYKTDYFFTTIFENKQEQAIKLYLNYLDQQKRIKLTNVMAYSRMLIRYLVEKAELDSRIINNSDTASFVGKYNAIKSSTRRKVRERALATLLIGQYGMIPIGFEADYLNNKSNNPQFKQVIRSRLKSIGR